MFACMGPCAHAWWGPMQLPTPAHLAPSKGQAGYVRCRACLGHAWPLIGHRRSQEVPGLASRTVGPCGAGHYWHQTAAPESITPSYALRAWSQVPLCARAAWSPWAWRVRMQWRAVGPRGGRPQPALSGSCCRCCSARSRAWAAEAYCRWAGLAAAKDKLVRVLKRVYIRSRFTKFSDNLPKCTSSLLGFQ